MKRIGLIFFLVVGFCALFINSRNAHLFGLQHAGIEAIVERGVVWIDKGSVPEFLPPNDTYLYRGHSYAMKQPGQFFLGAIPYFFLYLINIRFVNHYDFASHIITLTTSSVMLGLLAVEMARLWQIAKIKFGVIKIGLVSMVAGTLLLPYAGLPHHDIYATFFLTIGYLELWRYSLAPSPREEVTLWFAGFLTGFSLFFSMLPVAIVGVVLGSSWWILKSLREKKIFLLAGVFGIAICLIYNYFIYERIWLFPNIAGHTYDTYPKFNFASIIEKLNYYLGITKYSLWVFSPQLLWSVVGWRKANYKWRKIRYVSLLMFCIYILHVTSIETFGGYQYGPRYLIPLIPLMSWWIPFWLREKRRLRERVLFGVALIYGIVVALIGSLTTVMYPQPGQYAPWGQLQELMKGNLPEFRMWPFGIGLIGLGIAIWFYQREHPQTSRPS